MTDPGLGIEGARDGCELWPAETERAHPFATGSTVVDNIAAAYPITLATLDRRRHRALWPGRGIAIDRHTVTPRQRDGPVPSKEY